MPQPGLEALPARQRAEITRRALSIEQQFEASDARDARTAAIAIAISTRWRWSARACLPGFPNGTSRGRARARLAACRRNDGTFHPRLATEVGMSTARHSARRAPAIDDRRTVSPGFEHVREAFAANFARGDAYEDVGASLTVYRARAQGRRSVGRVPRQARERGLGRATRSSTSGRRQRA